MVHTDHAATIWLDRPQRKNAQTFATWSSLYQISQSLPPQTRVIVLRGSGSDFSAGLDLRLTQPPGVPREGSVAELLDLSDQQVNQAIAQFQQGFTCWRDHRAVVVAVIHGRAIGAGFQLALAADLRVATTDASFRMAEASLGLVPDLGGTRELVAQVGYAAAMDICLTARTVWAPEAAQLRLVQRLVEPTKLDDCVADLISGVCAGSPEVSTATKRSSWSQRPPARHTTSWPPRAPRRSLSYGRRSGPGNSRPAGEVVRFE